MNKLTIEDVWQRCPICNGDGTIPYHCTTGGITCPTCYGDRIISRLTGYPRSYELNAKETVEPNNISGIVASNGLSNPPNEVEI